MAEPKSVMRSISPRIGPSTMARSMSIITPNGYQAKVSGGDTRNLRALGDRGGDRRERAVAVAVAHVPGTAAEQVALDLVLAHLLVVAEVAEDAVELGHEPSLLKSQRDRPILTVNSHSEEKNALPAN